MESHDIDYAKVDQLTQVLGNNEVSDEYCETIFSVFTAMYVKQSPCAALSKYGNKILECTGKDVSYKLKRELYAQDENKYINTSTMYTRYLEHHREHAIECAKSEVFSMNILSAYKLYSHAQTSQEKISTLAKLNTFALTTPVSKTKLQ